MSLVDTHPHKVFFIVVLVTLGHLYAGMRGAEITLVCVLSLFIAIHLLTLFREWWRDREWRRSRRW